MRKYKLLFIDDDELFLFLTQQSFKNVTWINSLETATSQQNAIELLNKKSNDPSEFPDIIFIDFHIGENDGLEVAQYFHENLSDQFPDTTIFMLTSSSSAEKKSDALAIPVIDEVLQKPLTSETLQKYLKI